MSNVYYDETSSSFKVFTNTLKNTVKNDGKRKDVYRDWDKAIKVVFIVDKFFLLTKDKFLVYGTGDNYFNKLYEVDCISQLTK